ncbi:MAG TPA: DUF4193 family protein [Arthrobacter sp.]|nr:DUF4193 family protein [Arthrobacter sp.]
MRLPNVTLNGPWAHQHRFIPQAGDEFTCYSCFLVRHPSQPASARNGHSYCIECEG